MSAKQRSRRRWSRRTTASVAVLSLLTTAIIVAAVRTDGYHASKVNVDDASVWVFDTGTDYVGRLNSQTRALDAAVSAKDLAHANLWQRGRVVAVGEVGGPRSLDPVTVTMAAPNSTAQNLQLDANGGVSVIVAAKDGSADVWVGQDLALASFSGKDDPTIPKLSDRTRAVVAPDGAVLVVDPAAAVYYVVRLDAALVATVGPALPLGPGVQLPDQFQLTAVGHLPVFLFDSSVTWPKLAAPVTIDDADLTLQQAGPDATRVLVAGSSGLWSVQLGKAAVESLAEGSGHPARPVVLGQCAHAAWSGNATYLQLCGQRPATTSPLKGVGSGDRLTFRVNGRVIALNGQNGAVFLVDGAEVTKVDNWNEVTPKKQPDQPQQQSKDLKPAKCDVDVQRDPATTPDTYGAHPGQTITMKVLDNDHDANCDALAIVPPKSWDNAADGTLSVIDHGQAFQYQPADGASERSITVDYQVSDRDGNAVAAQATINVTSAHDNDPAPVRDSRTTVELGKSVVYDVLADVADADGDQLTLVDVQIPSGVGSVDFSPDGIIRYTASNTTPDPKTLTAVVSDSVGNELKQPLIVDVRPAGTAMPPTARNDYLTGRAGTDLLLAPLANDTDPNEDQLVLTQVVVDQPDQASVSQGDSGILRIRADNPGDYRITYFASDGSASSFGVIRFVATGTTENSAPVAVADNVTVQRARSVNINVLANDFDADGDVLVVTDATSDDPTIGEVEVVVVNGQYVRVTAGAVPTPVRPIPITYTVSDGVNGPVSAQLLVQVTASAQNLPPTAVDDQALVRAGDVVTADVLANDTDPEGDPLVITAARIETSTIGGSVWVSRNRIRFLAGSAAGRVYISYDIDDSPLRNGLHRRTAQVQIDVKGTDTDNTPPRAKPLEIRVYAGGRARVTVPLDGLDPDGDSVHLAGFGPISDSAATASKGFVTIDNDEFVYAAWPDSAGADTFTYQVEDAQGSRSAPATVRVTIVQSANHAPAVVRDEVTVRPGRNLQLPVLANDTDPDGDELVLADVTAQPGSEALSPEVAGGRVNLVVPDKAGSYVAQYTVQDGRGGESIGVVMVHADPEAPLLPPVPRDDPDGASALTVTTVNGVSTAALKLFDNDDDPDSARTVDAAGQRSDIVLVGTEPVTAGTMTGDVLSVPQTDQEQLVLYTVVDTDKLQGSALVVVPPQQNSPPRLKDPLTPISVALGEQIEIRVSDYVEDPDTGDTVVLSGTPLKGVRGTASYVGSDTSKFAFLSTAQDPALFQPTAKVSFEVTDDPTDPARSVRLELPITITFDGQLPLKTTDAEVLVEKSAGAKTVNLIDAGFVQDPNGAGAEFSDLKVVAEKNSSVSLAANGDVKAQAAGGASVGDSSSYSYTVRHGTATATGTLRVRVVASTRPLPTAPNFTFARLKNSESATQDVSDGAVNSYSQDGKQLTLVTVQPPTQGIGSVEWTQGSTSITFTPASTFAGTVTVQYTLADAADDPGDPRRATGTITYNVIGAPLQPPAPTVQSVRSHTVVLNVGSTDPNFWQGSSTNADYIVRWPGGEKRTGGATQVTIDNLPNNVPVQFTVTGSNDVGDGPPSPPSEQVRPDQIPDPPNPPRVTVEGDGSLTVVWDKSIPDGSPVQGYQLLVSDTSLQISELPAEQFTYTLTGLQNGSDYSFAIIARNLAETDGGKSKASPWSQPGRPYTVPDAPTNLVVVDDPAALGEQVRVTWTPPAFTGGRDLDGYTVTPSGGAPQTVTAPSAFFQLAGGNHSFTVVALNLRGAGAPIQLSYDVVNRPDTPSIGGISEAGAGAIQVAVVQPADWGNLASGTRAIEYSLNGGGFAPLAGNGVISGLVNCRSYSVVVHARNERYTSGDSGAQSGQPYGPPNAPGGLSGSPSGQSIVWNWNASGSKNGDCAANVTVQVDGGTISNSATGPYSQNFGAYSSGPHNLTVSVTDGRNTVSAGPVQQYTAPPPITVSISRGDLYAGGASNPGSCSINNCKWVNFSTSGWSPGQALSLTCYSNLGQHLVFNKNANASGSYSTSGLWMYGNVTNVYCSANGVNSNTITPWKDW